MGRVRRTIQTRRARDEVPGHRSRWLVAAVVVVVMAGAGAGLATSAFGNQHPAASGSAPISGGYQTSTQPVTRQSLTEQTQEDATLGDAGTWSVVVPPSSSPPSSSSSSSSSSASSTPGGVAGSSGVFTWLPPSGKIIRQGRMAYAVNGTAVVLLYGSISAYRNLYVGLTGPDVRELNADLVTLGYSTAAALGPRSGWDYYSAATAAAVERLQTAIGVTVTGTLNLGEAVFLPGPAVVTGLGTGTVLGGAATSGSVVLTATSTTPVITIDLDASLQPEVKDGDPVGVTLPDGTVTSGVITQVGTVASSSSPSSSSSSSDSGNGVSGGSPPTVTVLASLTRPQEAQHLDGAAVTVTITTGSVSNALSVPVDALLAETSNSYDVEVTGPGGDHLVPVTPGVFDSAAGLVQVTGDLRPGQRVVVPGA
jgi:Putative peptidoglycan binding domain